MTDAPASLTHHVREFDVGAHIMAATFFNDLPALALADGIVQFGAFDDVRKIPAHPEAGILAVASDGKRFLTGGDDGRIVETRSDGATSVIADEKGRWIDAVAMRGDSYAWSFGREVRARDEAGNVKSVKVASTARGLAFLPKGYRLALAHYDGVTLWFPNVVGMPHTLDWKGSHLDADVSPDGRFLVTTMQENALHGWRLADSRNMRMTGYPGKTRSLSWSHDGHWLATSGADACIIWPFREKDGPMGKAPRECGVRPARVTRAAFHPKALVVAIGYADGFVMLCRLNDAAEILVRLEAPTDGAVSALGWDARGSKLMFGTESGRAGILTLPN